MLFQLLTIMSLCTPESLFIITSKPKSPLIISVPVFNGIPPDFLIRHKITGEASWIEIKPARFDNFGQLALRKTVAENYIA
jgi:hypothetical protein